VFNKMLLSSAAAIVFFIPAAFEILRWASGDGHLTGTTALLLGLALLAAAEAVGAEDHESLADAESRRAAERLEDRRHAERLEREASESPPRAPSGPV
jgi:hypothetical protein